MERQTRKLLHDALAAIESILSLSAGITFGDFTSDSVRQKAIYYDFAVVGEALNKAQRSDSGVPATLSGIRPAVDMRNRLIHGYASVDASIVWSTIKMDLENLRDEILELLAQDEIHS